MASDKFRAAAIMVDDALDGCNPADADVYISTIERVLREEFAGYEEMKELLHEDIEHNRAVLGEVGFTQNNLPSDCLMARIAKAVGRLHENGDGTGTITPRQEPPIEKE